MVQQARKDAGLDISDRIQLVVGGSDEVLAALETHREYFMGETLAVSLELHNSLTDGFAGEVGQGWPVSASVTVA